MGAPTARAGEPVARDGEVLICALCGGSSSTLLYDGLEDVHYGGLGRFSLRRCTECRLVWLTPQPDDTEMRQYYGAGYGPYRLGASRLRRMAAPVRELLALPYSARFGAPSQSEPPARGDAKMLDVGCGPGLLMREMRRLGWEVWGIERDESAARAAARQAGSDERLFVGSIEDAEYPAGTFTLITASHVLEHLRDPASALRAIRSWLHPDGELRMWIPNIDSIEARAFGRHWAGLDVPRHLFHFSRDTISRLLDALGFEVVSIRPQSRGARSR
jgi:2-polyprenyl-3-methyl-5-hydroxy-6-metoxy-1,4-benzoquinol methylase